MKLHDDKKLFRELIIITAQYFKMPDVYVEKDYWITYLLKNLAFSPLKDKVVFKGGTSLSKAYKILDRFSEDVDLVVIDPHKNSRAKNERILSKIKRTIAQEPLQDLGKTHHLFKDMKGFKKRPLRYPKITDLNGKYGHATETLLLEMNHFLIPSPTQKKFIGSYISEFLKNNGYNDVISKFELEPFELVVLSLERTFFEKIVSLYRAAYKGDDELKAKIRHFYDLYILVNKNNEIKSLMQDEERFKSLLQQIIKEELHHEMFQDIKNIIPFSKTTLAQKPKSYENLLQREYNGSFLTMVIHDENKIVFSDVFENFLLINTIIVKHNI